MLGVAKTSARKLAVKPTSFQKPVACINSSFQQKRLAHNEPVGGSASYKVPDFSPYLKENRNSDSNRVFSYLMVGTFGLVSASAARATVQDFLTTMSASADVRAMAKIEVDLSNIPEGKNITVKWQGKPVFVRHRSAAEIKEAQSVNINVLRDPETDDQRIKRPEWLIMVGICTHLGCVPIADAGEYTYFCPCHGSHYDSSGRIRKGPAPLNLEVPEYEFEGDSVTIG